MITKKATRILIAGYLAIQSFALLAWWCLLILSPKSIQFFQPRDWPAEILLNFWLPDLALVAIGSILASWSIATDHRHTRLIVWFSNGAVWYSTLYCLAVSLRTDQAWIATASMVSMSGITLAIATMLGSQDQSLELIRVTPMKPMVAFGWTLLQVPIFWYTFLWILPKGIYEAESLLGVAHFEHRFQAICSQMVFIAASALGLWSAVSIAFQGRGTPLPSATAPVLVVHGPYRYIRNPMATAGIAQGLAIGWSFGSIAVLLYASLGAIVWHVCVRPVEERDLTGRFGDSYRHYQHSVGLWIPRTRPSCSI